MDSIKQFPRFKELLEKFRVTKTEDSRKTGKIVKRPKSKVRSGRFIPIPAVKKLAPIVKPTPIKSSRRSPTFVLPPSNRQSAFVPVRSPMKLDGYLQSALCRVEPFRSPAFDLNKKPDVVYGVERPKLTLKPTTSNSQDSGFEHSNAQDLPNTSSSTSFLKIQNYAAQRDPKMKSHSQQDISNLYQNHKEDLPVFICPKTLPYKPSEAEALLMKEMTEFVETVRNFTGQNIFSTSEVLFHLNNLQLCVIKKMSKSISLNRISRLRSNLVVPNDCHSARGSKTHI